ncbi:beta strand repeat-containing protein [Thioalkalivibrio sp. HK1]|uniref:beta strand repeat-containing protein n=1 Tax=Thioalkalivibrio sp. HK1 TaxID=1469245 RepID=UPI0012DCD23E|nr:hypothetical protein [Thioalkalivibrio sp. HK1]
MNVGVTHQGIPLERFPNMCVQYTNAAHQEASGFSSCGSLPTGCRTSGYAIVVPAALPPRSGTIQVTPAGTLEIDEGSSGSLSVALSISPRKNVTVTLSKTNPDVTLSPTSLSFTPSNYSTAQSVSVSAADDTDLAPDTDTITFTASGGITAPAVTKAVAIDDDDKPTGTITLAPAGALTIDEGESGTFSVSLSAAPGGDVTVSLSKRNADVTLTPASLTFTTSNYSTAQTVTVATRADDDAGNDTDTITLSASGGIEAPNVTKSITIEDDDEPEFTLTATRLTVAEGGQVSFGLRPATRPSENIILRLRAYKGLTIYNDLDIDMDPNMAGSQIQADFHRYGQTNAWNQNRTITLTAAQDADANDESVQVVGYARNGDYEQEPVTVYVTITDDDQVSGTIDVTPAALTIDEGNSGTLQVSLSAAPRGTSTLTLSKTNPDVTLSPTSLTFNASNYSTAQSVTVSASQDTDPDDDTDTITLSLSATGGVIAPSVTRALTIEDNYILSGTIQITPAGTLEVEEGSSSSISVSLDTAPSDDVRVTLSKTNADLTLSPTTLTFTPSNYSTGQSVSVSAAEDGDQADDTGSITLSATGGIVAPSVTRSVAIVDNDLPAGTIEVTPTGTLTIDEGASVTLSVTLGAAPSKNVTVSLSTGNSQVTLTPASLTFTPSNYHIAKTVTVSADQDPDDNDESDTITLTASGGTIAPNVTRALTVIDDEIIGTIQVTPSGALTMREGTTSRFRISLSDAPDAQATVSLSKTNPDVLVSPSSLTFDPSNYSQDRWITVVAGEDDDVENDKDTISIEVSGGISAPSITKAVTITDDEILGTIQVSPAGTLIIREGTTSRFRISLGVAPDAQATVSLSKTNPDVIVSPSSLTFDPSNYSQEQWVTVDAREDDDEENDEDTITIEVSGGLVTPSVSKSLTILDGDSQPPIAPPTSSIYLGGVVVTPSILTLAEGERAIFSVGLDTAPTSDVTVDLSGTNSDVGLAFDAITFTPSNWQQMADVAIFALEDSDTTNDSDTIAFSIENLALHSLAVFISDNDSVPKAPIKAQALAIPPPESGDDMTLRIRCRQDSPCHILLDCSTQIDGKVFEGRLPDPIPARGSISLSAADIQRHTGWISLGFDGRLGCSLRSDDHIGSQVWTRSGDNILVNNSAIIRSHPEGGEFRADIESIPSPESFDAPNIRIRCNSEEAHCSEIRFFCYTDDGARYETTFDGLARGRTLHLQSEALARELQVRWKNLGLTCEVRSNARFTAQVLARTGGGGALVNNSATGGR